MPVAHRFDQKFDSEAVSGRVSFASSRYCSEMVSNLTGTVKLSTMTLVRPWLELLLLQKVLHALQALQQPLRLSQSAKLKLTVARWWKETSVSLDMAASPTLPSPSSESLRDCNKTATRFERTGA